MEIEIAPRGSNKSSNLFHSSKMLTLYMMLMEILELNLNEKKRTCHYYEEKNYYVTIKEWAYEHMQRSVGNEGVIVCDSNAGYSVPRTDLL